MKKILGVVVLLMLVCNTPAFGQSEDFIEPDQIKEEIEAYYKEVKGRLIVRINLLDIFKSEEGTNIMYVYFLEDQNTTSAKDFYGNIDSNKTKVMVAVYTYSHFKYSWRLKVIRNFVGSLIFKVD